MTIRIVVADDHPAVLAGVEHVLARSPGIKLVGKVGDSTELVGVLSKCDVDVVITDFSMPQGHYGDGIALLRFLKRRFPSVKLAVLTSIQSPRVLQSILDVEVDVIVSKADSHSCIEVAIAHADARKTYLSPGVEQLVERAAVERRELSGVHLTKREAEVLRMYAEGFSVAEISARVGRSRKTIGTQKMAAMRKLGLQGDVDVFQYAMANGLIKATQASRRRMSYSSDDA